MSGWEGTGEGKEKEAKDETKMIISIREQLGIGLTTNADKMSSLPKKSKIWQINFLPHQQHFY